MSAFFLKIILQAKDHYEGVMKNKVLSDIAEAEDHYQELTKKRKVHFG